MVTARLFANDRLAVTATAWRIKSNTESTARYDVEANDLPALPDAPPDGTPQKFFSGVSDTWGYGRAIDWRFVRGNYDVSGPATVWTRLRIPLVAGENTSPTQRLLVVADSTNGLSGQLPITEWFFIPPTVTATIQRPPAGEWMLLDASSTIGPHGIGLAQASVHDEVGRVANIAQPLMVTPR